LSETKQLILIKTYAQLVKYINGMEPDWTWLVQLESQVVIYHDHYQTIISDSDHCLIGHVS